MPKEQSLPTLIKEKNKTNKIQPNAAPPSLEKTKGLFKKIKKR